MFTGQLTSVDNLALFTRILAIIGSTILVIASFLSFKVEKDRIADNLF